MKSSSSLLLSCAALLTLSAFARAQCPQWSDEFAAPGTDGIVTAAAVFDDGSGPALYLGGGFTRAGDAAANRVARFDGVSWSPLGAGMPAGEVHALCVFDDGSGPALFAGGTFTSAGGVGAPAIAKWNGTSWSGVGGGVSAANPLTVEALCVFDDGSGPALYAGGDFTIAGGVPASAIAKWNGTSWSAVGGGMNDWVLSLRVYDDGGGPALYAGGFFTLASGASANRIARWNGTSWSGLGAGITGAGTPAVNTLTVFDDGAGPALYAGGAIPIAGGSAATNVARWNGTSWSAPPVLAAYETVYALAAHDDGAGEALYVGTRQTIPPTNDYATSVRRWDGSSTSVAGSMLHGSNANVAVRAFVEWDRGTGPELIAGGFFGNSDTDGAANVAELDDTTWIGLTRTHGVGGVVVAFAPHDEGTGTRLFAGGAFRSAGDVATSSIARWSPSGWSDVGGGMITSTSANVRAIASFDDGSGTALYAGGDFTATASAAIPYLARWDGASWSVVGGGMNSSVYGLGTFDLGGGPALYACGLFTTAGGVTVNRIAKWNGSTWSSLAGGITSSGFLITLAVADFGAGPELVAGGSFPQLGGTAANNIARWNGTSWSPIGAGLPGGVFALATYDSGSGPELYAGGLYGSIGNVARWNGASWVTLGVGADDTVFSLATFDDGAGEQLYVGGSFRNAGGLAVRALARWNGTNWNDPGAAIAPINGSAFVRALGVFDDDHDGVADLFIGGSFAAAGGHAAANVTRLAACTPPITTFCPGDGSVRACPCGNDGAIGRGCANANFASGARLQALGTPSVSSDTLVLAGDALTGSTCVFFQGTANMDPIPVDDGLGCVTGSVIRLAIRGISANTSAYPQGADLAISVRGLVPPAGGRRFYQAYYRNASPVFCPPATSNRTNGVAVLWSP